MIVTATMLQRCCVHSQCRATIQIRLMNAIENLLTEVMCNELPKCSVIFDLNLVTFVVYYIRRGTYPDKIDIDRCLCNNIHAYTLLLHYNRYLQRQHRSFGDDRLLSTPRKSLFLVWCSVVALTAKCICFDF